MTEYEIVVGLEVHAELSTKTKAFCSCEYHFGGEVNTQCCPGCIGMPGTLPVLNKTFVDYALKLGVATNCEINKISKFDRKSYFYPDLARGYQVTQADIPICQNGALEFYHKGAKHAVRLTRIHIEEDTAKLLHDNMFKGTLLDFNRSGVALLEIVSEPDMRSAEEVKDYLEALRTMLSTLDICSCRMQEGAIRCDVNVSVRPFGQAEYGTRVEMKNVSTFSGALQVVEYESARQIELLESGSEIDRETRRWDEDKCVTLPMRSKENAADYRYFPESDLVPLVVDDEWIDRIRESLPELPMAAYERYLCLGVPDAESWLLVDNADKAAFFDACAEIADVSPRTLANWILGPVTAWLTKTAVSIDDAPISTDDLCSIITMVERGTISNDAAKKVLDEIFTNGGRPDEIVKKLSLEQVSDEGELRTLVQGVLDENAKSIEDYKNGKSNAFAYLMGQCMKASKGKGNPQLLTNLLREFLD